MAFSPFKIEAITRRISQNTILKLQEVNVSKHTKLEETETAIFAQNMFVSTSKGLAKRVDGEYYFPVLTETDVHKVLENNRNQARSAYLMAWAFIPIPLSTVAMPLTSMFDDPMSGFNIVIAPFVLTAAGLLCASMLKTITFLRSQRAIRRQLLERGGFVHIPKAVRKAQMKQTLSIWSGPIAAYVLDETVSILPDERIGLACDALSLGNDAIGIMRKPTPG